MLVVYIGIYWYLLVYICIVDLTTKLGQHEITLMLYRFLEKLSENPYFGEPSNPQNARICCVITREAILW